ncbi:MAG: hypothetical protein M0P02_01735 [Sulfurospirillaceae bacterium]|jgi:hypothetical protein|nr:hypothetical protein [Sulfurospirillaceae bacterium]MCK9545190.1 hypothetical protein [Sulfurospirillaceae bacterium]MDY0238161.1 hypothetical protein [Campylobacterales bacterium]NLM99036.1 hypothetical protein [Campylobacteraceae bacterium]
MKIYLVRGLARGLREIILSSSKERAGAISDLRKLGPVRVKCIDKSPLLRVATGGENEMLDFLEWQDPSTKRWHSFFTIDPALYQHSVLEILR